MDHAYLGGDYLAQAKMGQATAAQLSNAIQEEAALERFSQRLDGLGQAASEIAARIHRLADKAFGQMPEADTATGNQIRCGMVGQIEDHFDRLDTILNDAFQGLRRIEKIA